MTLVQRFHLGVIDFFESLEFMYYHGGGCIVAATAVTP
jgi:hypothetical protein